MLYYLSEALRRRLRTKEGGAEESGTKETVPGAAGTKERTDTLHHAAVRAKGSQQSQLQIRQNCMSFSA